MRQTRKAGSWQVTVAAFLTPAAACVCLVLTLGSAEIAVRLPAVRAVLYAPSVGSSSRQFELQLDDLDRYAAQGPVDCLVLGNSTALMGVDPNALGGTYHERTRRRLRCFTFGVAGMTASAAGAVAAILVDRYQPWLLIYATSTRDIGTSVDGPRLANAPWIRYRHGEFSVNGWLTEHSALFRYYLLYRQWFDPARWRAATVSVPPSAAGFLRFEGGLPLSAGLWAHTQRVFADIVRAPASEPELRGLGEVLQLTSGGTQVIVVEVPLHTDLWRWSRHVSSFYQHAIQHMRQQARLHRASFWRIPSWRLIPADAWADFVHLKPRGATRFSEWLGARVAAAVQSGRLKPPAPTSAE